MQSLRYQSRQNLVLLLHAIPQNLNLLLDLDPQRQLLQVAVIISVIDNAKPVILKLLRQSLDTVSFPATAMVRAARNGKQGGHKGLLDVGKAKLVSNLGDGLAKLVGEVDFFVALELVLPEVAVGNALL